MTDAYEIVISLLFKAIEELNQQLLPKQRVNPLPETVLIGDQAKLDSMALLTLLVIIEGKIGEEFGIEFVLVGENTIIDENIFKNLMTLARYIADNIDR